jgi:hypothetical protein
MHKNTIRHKQYELELDPNAILTPLTTICLCGGQFTNANKLVHIRTKRHQQYEQCLQLTNLSINTVE